MKSNPPVGKLWGASEVQITSLFVWDMRAEILVHAIWDQVSDLLTLSSWHYSGLCAFKPLRGKQIVQGNLPFFNCILGLKCLHEIHVPKLEKTNIFRPTFPVSRVESRPPPESVTVLECDMWHDIWAVTLSSLTSLGATWAGWHVTGSAWQMETLEEIGNSWHCKYNAKTSGHARNIHCNKDEV